MAACGGFSYGGMYWVPGSGPKSILFNPGRDQFESFFERKDSFTLGVCNGCQMLSNLHELIPGQTIGPILCATVRNSSRRVCYRAR